LQDAGEWRTLANADKLQRNAAHVLELTMHLKHATEVAAGHAAAVVKDTAL